MKKLISECMYWLGTIKISNFLNNLLHDVFRCAPTIILIILFCKVNISGYQRSFLGVKQLECEGDHSPPSTTEVRNN